MPTARSHCAAVGLPDGDILVTGGSASAAGGCRSTTVELLTRDPASGARTWRKLAPMRIARYCHGVAVFRQHIIVAGGYTAPLDLNKSVEMFVPPLAPGDVGEWTLINSLDRIRGDCYVSTFGDRLIAACEWLPDWVFKTLTHDPANRRKLVAIWRTSFHIQLPTHLKQGSYAVFCANFPR